MRNQTRFNSNQLLATASISAALLSFSGAVAATTFSSDLQVGGSVALSSIGQSPFSDGNVTQAGTISTTSGGTLTSLGYSTAPGVADAWAESKLDLELDNIDLLSSELLSDTFFGDAKNGVLLGSFGATVTDSGLFMFDVILAPGATALIAGTQQWEGGVYAVGGSFVDVSFGLSISNVSCRGACIVPPVPLPAAAYLFASALSGLVLSRRRRQRGGARGQRLTAVHSWKGATV